MSNKIDGPIQHTGFLAYGRSGLYPLLALVRDAILRPPGGRRAELIGHELQQRTFAPSN